MLTCLSCRFWRPTHCAINQPGYPQHTHVTCESFDYEPGVDELFNHEGKTNT